MSGKKPAKKKDKKEKKVKDTEVEHLSILPLEEAGDNTMSLPKILA